MVLYRIIHVYGESENNNWCLTCTYNTFSIRATTINALFLRHPCIRSNAAAWIHFIPILKRGYMTQVLNFSNKVKILPIFPFTILAIKKKKQSSRIYEPEKIRIYFSWGFLYLLLQALEAFCLAGRQGRSLQKSWHCSQLRPLVLCVQTH